MNEPTARRPAHVYLLAVAALSLFALHSTSLLGALSPAIHSPPTASPASHTLVIDVDTDAVRVWADRLQASADRIAIDADEIRERVESAHQKRLLLEKVRHSATRP